MACNARKRMRLSSPTYDAGLEDLDEYDLQELDRIELTLSQLVGTSSQNEKSIRCFHPSQDAKERRLKAIMLAIESDAEGSEKVNVGEKRAREEEFGLKSATSISTTNANAKYDHELPSSPEEPPQAPDYSKWFAPDPSTPLLGFQRVSKSLIGPLSDDAAVPSTFTPAGNSFIGAGFASASDIQKAIIEPSKKALELAAKKMKDWSEADESVLQTSDAPQSPSKSGPGFARPVLASVANSSTFRTPISPKRNNSSRSVSTPTPGRLSGADKTRTFRSPLLGQPSPRTVYPKAGPSSPGKNGSRVSRSARPHPLASTPMTILVSPERPGGSILDSAEALMTPVRPGVPTVSESARRSHKTVGFSTPFKQGMKPGEPGRAVLEKTQQVEKTKTTRTRTKQDNENPRKGLKLKDSGLMPQRHSVNELEQMGLNITELSQINPETAIFYVFHTSESYISSTQTQVASAAAGVSLGPADVHVHLLQAGRTLASRKWVNNHWSLVLWKLAGLACLQPERENTPERRWCWRSVLEQFEARYDRELAGGSRPPLRLIAAQDAPAGAPIVLVVTRVLWTQAGRVGKNGRVIEDAGGELEVSDGWYRLKAPIDAPLARAVLRGAIKAGRKIAVAGAKVFFLDNDKREPSEILEAYEACSLLLSGNGTHLAPWHAKLGFQPEPFIATLGSLTPDGGPVPLIDLVVEKVYPIAFLEFLAATGGKKTSSGPRSEAEEAEVDDEWRKRRDAEELKLQDELSARWCRLEDFADRLERTARGRFNPSEDESPPEHIDDLFDELDELPADEIATFIRQLTIEECGFLARFIRRKVLRDKELAPEEIEIGMKDKCPPRDVRNFRIVIVRDAQTRRRPANRIAQLTLWDVLSLCVSEGGRPGAIEIGQRFLLKGIADDKSRSNTTKRMDGE
ncbi:hypothetical protein EW145_g6247 [Phellinidium pouzarii]|uniref:BRCA2 OB1 domain-containing protein n=1 Tax=Phellinidium pouzarii TaxID=167371 RepID=A0A4S4KX63_9AGAM|nr:hypothetical protein EW145_g6247 [Phellinidium pouzarii]